MQQDSNFSYTPSEESSDPPQLAFPEPGQPAMPMIPMAPVIPTTQTGLDIMQLPFPIQQAAERAPTPLPSTEIIDTANIHFLQHLPVTETDERSEHVQIPQQQAETDEHVQIPFPPQDARTSEIMRIPQMPLPPELPANGTGIQNPTHPSPQASTQNAQSHLQLSFSEVNSQALMPGLIEIPFGMKATPEQEESQPLAPSNQDAKRAIINGVIALIVSTCTFITIAGLAGLIIGTFSIIYGLMGLRLARRLPNKTGQGQATIGIVLGLIAWCIVIAAIISHVPQSS